ncbi:MAG: 2Fe-2S iron-sulfur cluster-binding protein [Campylobacterota bacterium]|nr:2Fe-2S iron-sulfur cluster-binding protein [Campylobacterota bacterium]
MKLKICDKQYDIETKVDNLLTALTLVKQQQNSSLAFRSGCRSGVCGSCAVTVNGIEKLACKSSINSGDHIQPLKNSKVIKDLIVDLSNQEQFLSQTKTYLSDKNKEEITIADEKKIDVESNCILCQSCFSACPVYEVNKDFIAPFAQIRAFRYINDKKESEQKTKIDALQTNAIWSCTLCGNCNMVCPSHIDLKGGIMQLRNKSVQFGYTDPNMTSFDGGLDFQNTTSFGFDPNGF